MSCEKDGRDAPLPPAAAAVHRAAAAEIRAAAGAVLHLAARSAAPVEQRQLAAELLQHDLGRLALVAVLVRVFARLQLALE